MTNVWCVRAEFGTYTPQFLRGGYAGIGFIQGVDLSEVESREELYPIYRKNRPEDTSNLVVGQQVGQIARFLFEIGPGDYIITPAADTEWLHYGQVAADSPYYYSACEDGTPYPHRRRVEWDRRRLRRSDFSVPFQNTIRSSLTVFFVKQPEEFLVAIGKAKPIEPDKVLDPHQVVLERILQLDAKEFEILITHLLEALGFEGTRHTGKSGDGGVDATGELNVGNLAKVKIFVQAKRYQPHARISAKDVKQLRTSIPHGAQGAFITTASFQEAAGDVALDPEFPRIGLVNGRQLVDLLVEHWDDIPQEFRDRLGLKPGLVRA